MTLKIRLARGGAKKRPHYRIVVADSRSPRDGRFIERIGTYDPLLPKDHAASSSARHPLLPKDRVTLREERIRYWLSQGAQPTDRVAGFLGQAEIIPMPARRDNPQKAKPKAKAQARLDAAAEAAAPADGEASAEA